MNSVLKTSLNKIYHTLQELKENGYFHMQRLFQFHQNDSTDTESEDDSILELDNDLYGKNFIHFGYTIQKPNLS